jgi:hypothetical protein
MPQVDNGLCMVKKDFILPPKTNGPVSHFICNAKPGRIVYFMSRRITPARPCSQAQLQN